MAIDKFKSFYPKEESPASNFFDIVLSDSDNLPYITRAIFVGVTGDVKITSVDDETVTFKNMQAGAMYPIRVKRVFSTGTTATNLIGCY